MRRKIIRITGFILSLLMLLQLTDSTVSASSAGVSLVVDNEGNYVTIPDTYEVETTYKYLGDYGFFNHAEDLFVDDEDNLYVVDTGNNRVLKISYDGEVLAEYTEAYGVTFNNPKGVYVHSDGTIWVADTNNYRVAVINQDGSDYAVYYKPDSSLLEDSFSFAPEKVSVSNTGYIYVLKGTSLMKIDFSGEFRGYVGADEVGFSLTRTLIRMFGTQSQIERTVKQEPSAYSNFTIASDGYIYGVLATATEGQIRRLNSVGVNSYDEELSYGFEVTYGNSTYTTAYFSDIAVTDSGIVTIADKNTGLIYQYTQDGELLAAFGGTGDKKGVYQNISAIDYDSTGRLYVLDYSTGSVTVLSPTNFIELVHTAVSLYNDGNYTESKEYWTQVLELDANYAMAHSGYAKVLYKEGDYETSMEQYRLGDDKEGYSKAFSKYRLELFREYFGWVCLAAVLIVGGMWLGYKKLKKYADAVAHRVEYGGNL